MRYKLWLRSVTFQWIPVVPTTGDLKTLPDVWRLVIEHNRLDDITGVAIIDTSKDALKTFFTRSLASQLAYWQESL